MKNETARREIESLDYYLQNHTDDYSEESHTAMMMAIKALEQEPCNTDTCKVVKAYMNEWDLPNNSDAISRQAVQDYIAKYLSQYLYNDVREAVEVIDEYIGELPSVNPQPKTGHCKDCKYFEYDSVAKVDGIPLIVAHENCSRWGDGCKTKENGYCFLKKFDFILDARDKIKNLPPITPQPKIEKWIKSRDSYGNNHFTCPFCEHDIATKGDTWEDNHCSNCGAKMDEVEDGNK